MDQPPLNEPPPREPIFNVPRVVLLLIVAFAAVHLWRLTLDEEADLRFLIEAALVPARLSIAFGVEQLDALLNAIMLDTPVLDRANDLALAQAFLNDGESRLWTLLSYSFLHGDFTHLMVNSVWLLAFGTTVARRFAPVRFLVFFVFCSVAAGLVQWLSDMDSVQPVIGASGAIAGMMGAALRFMFREEIRLGPGAERYAFLPRLTLRESFLDRRVLSFVAVMLGINILIGLGFQVFSPGSGKIAWQAHVGGFLAGLLAFGFFDPVGSKREASG